MSIEKEMSLNELIGTLPAGYKAVKEYNDLLDELEKERVRLAGCGVAALGYHHANSLSIGDYGHSASLDDVIKLRKRKEQLERALIDIYSLLEETMDNV